MENHAPPPRAVLSSQAGFAGLVGESAPMHLLYELIDKVSQCTSPVLVLGETGTGKELVARAIHFKGLRREKAFVPVDCSALTLSLVESELFGHVKGAFTGADRSKLGLLQAANAGTIFLDEIGELPIFLQAKLLRALQEHEIRPVGGNESFRISARFIAATNRNLEAEITAGRFRQDLFFRLNVLQIRLPALRERKSDIPLLVKLFLEKHADLQPSIRTVSEDAMQCLMSYAWPGNVRELENAMEHALAFGAGPVIEIDDLPPRLLSVPSGASFLEDNEMLSLREMERRAILRALRKAEGDRLVAARLLHIGKTTLYRKLKEYGATDTSTPTSCGNWSAIRGTNE